MALIRPKDLDTKSTLASTDEVMLDGDTTGSMPRDTFIAQVAALIVASPSTYKLATLDGADKLTSSQDPSQAVSYIGTHNVSTNSPTLIDGTGTAGDTYQVNVAGTRDYGSGSLTLAVGDALVYSGSVWQQVAGVANILDGISTPSAAQTALEVVSRDEYSRGVGTKLVGPAISFDGVDDYIEIADSDKLSFTDGTDDLPFSIGGWIKKDDATNLPVITKWGTGVNDEWAFWVNASNKLELIITDATNTTSITADTALTSYEGKFIHVACVYGGAGPNSNSAFSTAMSGGNAVLYINGVAVAATASDNASYTGMTNGTDPVWVARYSNLYADGQIKDVKLFNRELTASEVTSLYNEGQLGFADEWGGAIATSGTLTVGKRYRLRDFIAGDDFTNVGADSNADGVEFIATGTTPTTWSNSSEVENIGTLLDARAENFDTDTGKLYDISDNAFVGTNNGASLVGRTYPVYETGTWTPTITFGGGSTGLTISSSVASYTRIGNLCHISGALNLSAKGSSTGVAQIQGLPFASTSGTSRHSITFQLTAGMAGLTSMPIGQVLGNNTVIALYDWGATGTAALSEANFTDTTYTRFSGTYQIQ